ncbi:MAG: DUF305 domain-containing protein [Hyphomicrobiales bacterium]|nr:DUF305 domain-containing protein [Hyphomicrobiales bacterium]
MKTFATACAALALLAASVAAQPHGHGHHGHHGAHSNHGGAKPSANEATAAYQAANDKMHKDMAVSFTGDADVDLLRGMIPHHQGAIDMAKVALKYGKDAEVRKMAEQIIKAQEEEIAQMEAMLKRLQK